MLREQLHNISIEELLESKQISVRTKNCCLNAKFDSLLDVIDYYESGESFYHIRNAGRRTCLELERLCKSNIRSIETEKTVIVDEQENIIDQREFEEQIKKNELEEYIKKNNLLSAIETNLLHPSNIFNYILPEQREMIANNYKKLAAIYSARTSNRLMLIGYDKFIKNYLFNDHNHLLNIKNFGIKSLEEGIDFKEKLFDELSRLINLSEEEFNKLILVQDQANQLQKDFVFDFFTQYEHKPMFWIIEQQIKFDDSRDMDILINSYPLYNDNRILTLEELAKKHNITRERARQIRYKMFQKIFRTDGVFNTNICDWEFYRLSFEKENTIFMDNDRIQNLLKIENCNLSAFFVMQIIAYVFKDKFSLLGKFCLSSKTKNNTFLIRKELTEIFDFEKFILEFANHIDENDIEYELNVDEFLSNSSCWFSVIDLDKFNDIVRVVKDILLYEFHLYSNLDGLITIQATKERSPLDVIYEILKKNGNPMHLDDIFVEFKKILPEHKYTEPAQLRSWLQRHDAISFINRKSVYTLKEWEHIKSGTIRDTIIEFLLKNDLPQTADDITEYVLQYFPKTNIASVRTTMLNDTQKRFLYFNNSLFGLVSKKYQGNYEKTKQQERQLKVFEQRLYDLEKFLSENDHFPFATSDNEEECSLYRWWKIQNRDTKLSERQKAEIDRIKNQYADFDTEKTVCEWFYHFNHFKLFVLENRRLPLSSGSEKFLYGWLRRAKDDFLNDRLNQKQRTKYAELFKEIKYVER